MLKKEIERIIGHVEASQGRASARTISLESLREQLNKLKRKPFFSLKFSGGKVANSYKYRAESTFVSVVYDRETKHLGVKAFRGDAGSCAYGQSGGYYIDTKNRSVCVSRETLKTLQNEVIEKMQPDYPDYILHINEYLKVKYQVVARLAGEEYHFEIRKTPYKAWNLAKKLAEGVELIKERIEKESKIAKVLSSRLVFVGIHDCLESGNCRSESETLKTKISDMFDGEIGGVSHDFLFENRNDIYTKRAVEQAASRFIK